MARGSVYKRGKRWYIRYDAGVDEATGRRTQPSGGGFATRQEAQAALVAALAAVASGAHVKQSRETFAGYAAYWLDTVVPGTVRGRSRRGYEITLRLHLIPALGRLPLQAIRPADVRRLYRELEASGLAPQTIRHVHARLAQIFRCAVKERILAGSPLDDVVPPRIPRAELRVWTAAELDRFLALTAGEPLGALWHLYAMTGLREAEGVGLRWADVDWKRGRLQIRQQVVREGGALVLTGDLKTEQSRRTVIVGAGTMEMLAAHRSAQLAERLAAGPAWHDRDLVFPRPLGAIRPPRAVCEAWAARVAKIELPRITLHGLRHTHATIMLAEGANVKMLAARLGHDPAVLLRTYAHAIPDDQGPALARFEAALAASRAPALDGAAGG